MSERKSVCIFDFDGTLVNSMGEFAEIAAELMEEAYQTPRAQARDAYLRTSGLPFFQQLETLYPGDPQNSEVAQTFEEKKKEGYWQSPFFQEVPQIIEQLRAHGVRTVVSSNNGQRILEQYLAQCPSPKPQFDLVLGWREGFAKGPDHFEEVFDHFEIDPEEALFVGDSLQDAKKALAFGVDFVGRVGTFSREAFKKSFPQVPLVEDFSELPEVLCKSFS